MQVRRMAAVAAVGVLVALGIAACGGSNDTSGGALQAEAPANSAGDGDGGGSPDAASQGAADTSGGTGASPKQPQGGQQPSAYERKVVRSAQLSIEVEDLYGKSKLAVEVSERFGGYVADEKTSANNAWLELKVDTKDLDAAMNALAELGSRVISRAQQAQDVTEQYVDLQSRITTQRASVERIRALLANATAINEIVQVESELTTRQADLESLERRMAALSGQTELASVSVTMVKPGDAAVDDDDDTGFLAGLTAGWDVFLKSTQVMLTVFGAVLPFLVALSIPAVVVVWLLRRRRPVSPVAVSTPPAPSAGA